MFEPGKSGNLLGRPKGIDNSTTKEIKEIFANLLANNQEKLQDSLDRLYRQDPNKFLEIYIKLSERFLPKKTSTEITGKDGEEFNPINIVIPPKI